jgi:hypothetical protein
MAGGLTYWLILGYLSKRTDLTLLVLFLDVVVLIDLGSTTRMETEVFFATNAKDKQVMVLI